MQLCDEMHPSSMRRAFLFLFILAITTTIHSQVTSLRGVVRDSLSGEPLEGVVIWVPQSGLNTISDSEGKFVLKWNAEFSETVALSAQLFGYQKYIDASIKLKLGRTVTRDILLAPKTFTQQEVVIRPSEPEEVWGDDVLNVADFGWLKDAMVLLTYEKENRWKSQQNVNRTLYSGCQILVLDSSGNERGRCRVPEYAERIHISCFNDVFVVGKDSIWWVSTEEGIVIQPFPLTQFEQQIAPLVDTLGGRIFYSTWQPDYPAFEYKAYNPADSSLQTLRYLVNEPVMEMFRSSFKYMHPTAKLAAFKHELRTGIDKEIVAGYMTGFSETNYFEPMNAPLVLKSEQLLLFDHHHDRMVRFDRFGAPVDSVWIGYHHPQSGKWSGKLLSDKSTERIYSCFEKGGHTSLHEIDVSAGTLLSLQRLHWKYVQGVAIRDGWAYYTYRPFESSQNRFLYREKIGLPD